MQALEREDLLPVIVFIFSRAACDDAVHQLRRDGLLFTKPEERREIEQIAEARLTDFSAEDLQRLSTRTSSTRSVGHCGTSRRDGAGVS